MRRLTRNEKILACILPAVAALAHHQFILTPWKARSVEAKGKIALAKSKLETGRRTYEDLKNQIKTPARAAAPQVLVLEFDRSNDRFSKLISELTREAQAASLRLKRLSTEKPSTSDAYVKSAITLDVDASFIAIGKFLERLGDLPILAEVDSLEIYRVEGDLRKCSARIKLLSYLVRH